MNSFVVSGIIVRKKMYTGQYRTKLYIETKDGFIVEVILTRRIYEKYYRNLEVGNNIICKGYLENNRAICIKCLIPNKIRLYSPVIDHNGDFYE